jgi:TP901 family phage tail tape measure protein
MTLARLVVLLGLDSRGFQMGLAQAQAQLTAFRQTMAATTVGANFAGIGRGLTYGLTIPLIAAAAAIGITGNKLASEMGRVQSVIAQPGDMRSDVIAGWTDGVQALGVQLGRTSPEVTGGLYEIVSAFGELPNTMEFLEIAGRAAVAGQSDIVTSTRNLALMTRAWGDSSTEAARRMADLGSATVRVGTLTESEMGGAMSGLLPVMKLYNVGLEQGFAGLATLAGVSGSASQASTQLQRAITSLVAPNTTMLKLYKQYGITSGEVLIEQKGLIGAFQEIVRISDETRTPLQKMLGRLEAVKAVASLTGPQLEEYSDNLAAMAEAAGDVDRAFAGATGGIDKAGFEWAVAIQRLRVMAEDLYIAFAPAAANVAAALSPIGGALEGMAQGVSQMDTDKLTIVVGVLLGLALLGPVVSIIGSIATTLGALKAVAAVLAGPVGLAALAIAGLAFALYLVKDDLAVRWHGLLDGIEGRARNVGEAIEYLRDTWDKFRNPPDTGEVGHITTLKDVARAAGDVVAALGPPQGELSRFEQRMIESPQKVQTAWDLFWGGFADNWPDFSQLGSDIGTLWSNITTGAAGAGVGISSGISPAVMGVGRDFGTMASDAAREMNKIPPSAQGAAKGAKGAFTSVGWSSVGSSIASGIAQGITSGASWIASAAKAAASSALSAAKSVLGINSPSRVFRDQVGLMIPAGLALGITDGAGLVSNAMTRLVTPPALAHAGGYGGVSVRGGGGDTISHTDQTINIYVTAAPGATQHDGEQVGMGIKQAMQRRGLV